MLISFALLVCQFFLFDLSFFLRFEGGLAARFCRKLHDIDVQKRVTFVKLTIFMQIRAQTAEADRKFIYEILKALFF